MQRLEISGAVRTIYGSLGVKRLSSSSFLRLLPRLPVTSIPPFVFPSITRCRRQFQGKMSQAFRLRISRRVFLCSLIPSNTLHFPHDRSNGPSSAPHFKIFQAFLIYCRSVQVSAPCKAMLQM